jgi:hypothetical protein
MTKRRTELEAAIIKLTDAIMCNSGGRNTEYAGMDLSN